MAAYNLKIAAICLENVGQEVTVNTSVTQYYHTTHHWKLHLQARAILNHVLNAVLTFI